MTDESWIRFLFRHLKRKQLAWVRFCLIMGYVQLGIGFSMWAWIVPNVLSPGGTRRVFPLIQTSLTWVMGFFAIGLGVIMAVKAVRREWRDDGRKMPLLRGRYRGLAIAVPGCLLFMLGSHSAIDAAPADAVLRSLLAFSGVLLTAVGFFAILNSETGGTLSALRHELPARLARFPGKGRQVAGPGLTVIGVGLFVSVFAAARAMASTGRTAAVWIIVVAAAVIGVSVGLLLITISAVRRLVRIWQDHPHLLAGKPDQPPAPEKEP